MAELMLAAVTVPPLTVLHAEVTHCVRTGGVHGLAVVSPSGSVGGSPAYDQSIARLGARMPDQDWPKHGIENARKSRQNFVREFIRNMPLSR